ncbi:MAG: phosphonopyruvate decarboxylase [Bacteroidetes bacterium]|nr:phosphonopyruvate decarboxylase [Bacteroidota bacterium]
MISPENFFGILKDNGINFFTGVPDSLLKNFCAYVTDNVPDEDHVINSNEGAAVALASGYYLSTGKPAMVYMQNSGLGNSVNPLLSLADKEVYSIPLLLLIGWRGEPGKKDEPQHKKQGRVMLKMLEAMEIPFEIINQESEDIKSITDSICHSMKEKNCPHALVISEGTFEEYKIMTDHKTNYLFNREDAVKLILGNLSGREIIVSTTGKTSREVFEYRKNNNQGHKNDFLTVGSMGHSSQIALGISLKKSDREVFALDGDGAVIMQMGSLSIIGEKAGKNFRHILLNNGSHDSVGGQPTAGFNIDFPAVAMGCGFKLALKAETKEEILGGLNKIRSCEGPSFLEIRVNKGARKDLGRPDITPADNKINFMKNLI